MTQFLSRDEDSKDQRKETARPAGSVRPPHPLPGPVFMSFTVLSVLQLGHHLAFSRGVIKTN